MTTWTSTSVNSTSYTSDAVFTWNFLLQENGGKVLQEDDYKLRVDKTWETVNTWTPVSTNNTVWS